MLLPIDGRLLCLHKEKLVVDRASEERRMVNGISNSVRNFQLSVESYQSQELQQKTGDDSIKETSLNESLAFELNLSKSMQVVEGESKRSVTRAGSSELPTTRMMDST